MTLFKYTDFFMASFMIWLSSFSKKKTSFKLIIQTDHDCILNMSFAKPWNLVFLRLKSSFLFSFSVKREIYLNLIAILSHLVLEELMGNINMLICTKIMGKPLYKVGKEGKKWVILGIWVEDFHHQRSGTFGINLIKLTWES